MFAWHRGAVDGKWVVSLKRELDGWEEKELISAFTCAELGKKLPAHALEIRKGHKGWEIKWFQTHSFFNTYFKGVLGYQVFETTEVNARAKMLIYLIEANLIEKGKK